jgi:hypothetical protein
LAVLLRKNVIRPTTGWTVVPGVWDGGKKFEKKIGLFWWEVDVIVITGVM